jgi:hypothetical protein
MYVLLCKWIDAVLLNLLCTFLAYYSPFLRNAVFRLRSREARARIRRTSSASPAALAVHHRSPTTSTPHLTPLIMDTFSVDAAELVPRWAPFLGMV